MKPFDLQDTAMILIDHQVGTNTWAMSTPLALLQWLFPSLPWFAEFPLAAGPRQAAGETSRCR